ncbi:MAG TPA: hypothetical protein PK466_14685 [Thermotogota bacterium]|nr:hypothetical protein [Thermotogota bacterium]HPJ89703.1 hypothetical protein [Thermotogota bacterium]HPR97575.1 hypothetical protein [Thermotogota bacterium]
MPWNEIFWFLVVFLAIQLIYMLLLSRGKVSKEYLKNNTVYKMIAISVMLIIMNFVDYRYIFIGLLALYTYIIIKWIFNVVKGRETATRLLLFTGVYVPILLSNFFPKPWNGILMMIGCPMSLIFLWHTYKNPYYNACWLDTVINEIMEGVNKGCNYTSRPIVLERESSQPFIVTYKGIKIWFKKEYIIFKISENYFNKLGRPDLKSLAERVSEKILDTKYPTSNKMK